MTDHPVLVTAATGKTGRRVLARLQAMGVPVRAAHRPAFDWTDRATYAPAVAGARAAYVAYAPDLAAPGGPEAVERLAREAAAAGLERLVLLSGRGEPRAQEAERRVLAAFPGATVVRCAFFAQDFTESFMAEEVAAGELALPAGDVPEPFVDAEDVAEVAVAALTQDGHAGLVHELTGPEALTFAQAAARFGATYVEVPRAAYADAMRAAGVPEADVQVVDGLFAEVLDGRNSATTDGVRRVLGRDPRPVAA